MQYIATAFAVLLLTCSVAAQGFPWNDFKPGTVKSMMEEEAKMVRPDESMFLSATHRQTRAEVTYTGKSRAISAGTRSFLLFWTRTLGYGKDYADLFDTEYLYKEGETDYWLPTQTPITKYFAKELKPNDKMVLFLIAAGAHRNKDSIDAVILVEEYQLPQNLPKVIKPTSR
jgi:hypothetical protein